MQLTKTFTGEQFAKALESWQWLDLAGKQPRFTSTFGDVFLRSEAGWWFLDRLEGKLERLWDTEDAMAEALSTEEGQDRYLLGGLVMAAQEDGMLLGEDEIYDFMPPPILGGDTKFENMTTAGFVITLDIAGQLHDQIRKLPPGTRISKIKFVED